MYCSSIVLCQDGDIRLVGGSTSNQGRVEVCMDETWGTVCHDSWSSTDARVVCRQLGYSTNCKSYNSVILVVWSESYYNKRPLHVDVVAYASAKFGQGSGPIHLDDVACRGDESRLTSCNHDTSTSDCYHSEDAGVFCQPSGM